jgi:uncharacterized protein (DUF2384 family)
MGATNMANIDYNSVLKRIENAIREREEELDYAGVTAYQQKKNALSAWLESGMKGNCPIDLGEFGLDVLPRAVDNLPKGAPEEPVAPKKTSASGKETSPSAEKRQDEPGDQTSASAKETPPPAEKAPESSAPDQAKETLPSAEKAAESDAPLTPEERNLQILLKQVRGQIEAGHLREAVALAASIAERATGSAKEMAEQFLEEARQKREAAISLSNQQGDDAFHKGDIKQAQEYYQASLELDPDNAYAKSMLRKIEGDGGTGKISGQKAAELRSALRDLKNIKRLGAAVYEAEALDSEGRLTEELQNLLREARKNYDNLRLAHGEETTMMRLGDLASRKQARDKIAERVAQGEDYVYDATSNTMKPAFDLLREADKLLEEKSAETAQYELDVINRLLPSHPAGARSRLEAALSQPFHEEHRRQIEAKLTEINELLERQEKAEAYLAQADEEGGADGSVRAYAKTLQARDMFPYLLGIETRLAQARKAAEEYIVGKMESDFLIAQPMLIGDDADKAVSIIEKALHAADDWPHTELPERITALIAKGKILLEFATRASAIRKEAQDPNRVGMALKKLEEMRKDERFASLPGMRDLLSEMDQYRDAGDQLREAREARMAGDWRRVFDLTTKLRESGSAGNLAQQASELHAEAEREILIEDARALLDNMEIKKANAIITQVIAAEKDLERRARLQERLKAELEIVHTAIANTPIMQPVFDRAQALRNQGEDQRLRALRLFRFIGNMGEKPEPDLPDFVITLRTADARQAAVEIVRELTARCWLPIEKAFNNKRKQVNQDEIERLAHFARILREANLVDSAEKRAAVRWAEVEWAKVLAQGKEEKQDWEGILEIWNRLNEIYPEDQETAKRLEEARQSVEFLQNILRSIVAEKPRDTLMFIRDALSDETYRPFYPLLKQKRDQVFAQAQENLLRQSREALASGSADGKTKAFISLVDLQDLEEIVGVPESRRRSVGELKALNPNDFRSAAEVIVQRSTTFSVAQHSVSESIRMTQETISRLEALVKVARLFPGRWSDLEERIERRNAEMIALNHKLEDIDRILKEARSPELWNDALKRGSFDALRMKRDAMAAVGIPSFTSIPDIREFDQKMRDWQEAYDLIKNQAEEMKKAFDVDEDFKKVVDISRRLASRPMDWPTVTHTTYEQILAQVDAYLFRVINIYGDGQPLTGRVEIETAAREREAQYELWLSWDKRWRQTISEAEQAMKAVNRYASYPNEPTAFQLRDWKIFEEKARATKEILQNPPGEERTIRSRKTLSIFKASQQALDDVEQWLIRAAAEIDRLDKSPKFPSAAEFSEAVNKNDLPGLERLLERAKRVGALSEEEEKRLAWYHKVFEGMKQKKQKKPFWQLR